LPFDKSYVFMDIIRNIYQVKKLEMLKERWSENWARMKWKWAFQEKEPSWPNIHFSKMGESMKTWGRKIFFLAEMYSFIMSLIHASFPILTSFSRIWDFLVWCFSFSVKSPITIGHCVLCSYFQRISNAT
jgi:hypothetical protein